MDDLSEKNKQPLAQIALYWSSSKTFVTTAIVGVRNPKEAKQNTSTFEWQISLEDLDC